MTGSEPPDLDGYEVLGRVRPDVAGGVWQARDVDTGDVVALKQVPASAVSDLHRSVSLLARLQHPHVSRILGFVEVGSTSYLVAEWVEGATLDLLTSATRLSPAQALGVVRGVLLGLAHSHARGLVHGNVSAATIVLDRAGQPWLTGFGLEGSPAADVRRAAQVLVDLLAQPDRPGDLDALPVALRGVLADGADGKPIADAGALLAVLADAAEQTYGDPWWTTEGIGDLVAALE